MRSRTGCLTCRTRKLKCDETKPICGPCRKANRTCEASTGITFRHQHNASMNMNMHRNGSERGRGPLGSFYAYKNTFDRGTVWVDIPRELTFCLVGEEEVFYTAVQEQRQQQQEQGLERQREAEASQRMLMDAIGGGDKSSALNVRGLEALSAAALCESPQQQEQHQHLPVSRVGRPKKARGGKHGGGTVSTREPDGASIDPKLMADGNNHHHHHDDGTGFQHEELEATSGNGNQQHHPLRRVEEALRADEWIMEMGNVVDHAR